MKKTVLMATAAAGALAVALAAAPAAQAFSGKRDGEYKTHGNSYVDWRGDRHVYARGPKEHHKYGARFRYGFPEDCAMLGRRAHLTDNDYWWHAYKRCRTDYYKYH